MLIAKIVTCSANNYIMVWQGLKIHEHDECDRAVPFPWHFTPAGVSPIFQISPLIQSISKTLIWQNGCVFDNEKKKKII